MYIQVYQDSRVVSFPAVAQSSLFFSSPLLRPRLQGYRGSLQGAGYDAILADEARVLFTFIPYGGATTENLKNFEATISIEQAPVAGVSVQEDYPANVYNVSGVFYIEGKLQANVSVEGICKVKVTLKHYPAQAVTGAMFLQVLAAERALDSQSAFKDEGQT